MGTLFRIKSNSETQKCFLQNLASFAVATFVAVDERKEEKIIKNTINHAPNLARHLSAIGNTINHIPNLALDLSLLYKT